MATKPELPKWVTDDAAAKISDPGPSKKLAGFLYKEKVAFQFINWLFNVISKWALGLQGGFYDVVIGSAAQVTANEATHVLADLDDTVAVAGARVLLLDGTHTLAGALALTNAGLKIKSESPLAILDVATFTATFSGARNKIFLRVTNSGAGDIIVSGAGSIFSGIDLPIANVAVSNGATATTSGTAGGIETTEFIGDLTGTADTATNALSLGGSLAALFAKLLSPAFTGTPTAPTPTAGDSTTKLATTAFVQSAVGGAGVVGQTQLKTAQGSISQTTSGSSVSQVLTLPGGEYGFYPTIQNNQHPGENSTVWSESGSASAGTFVRMITAYSGSNSTGICYQRYVQSSPPYKIGDIGWGHFLFVLQNRITGDIVASYEADDPPWAYNGPSHHGKDTVERITSCPHPFVDYGSDLFPEDTFDVVLVDLREFNMGKWKKDNLKLGKGVLENIQDHSPIGKVKTIQSVGIPEILGFTDKIKIKARQ